MSVGGLPVRKRSETIECSRGDSGGVLVASAVSDRVLAHAAQTASGMRSAASRVIGSRTMSTSAMHAPAPHVPPDESRTPRSAIPPADLDRVYADLRRHAQNLLAAERPAHTLEATALVHEAMVKLLGEFGERPVPLPPEENLAERRKTLFAMLSLRMRHVLVEHARHRNALKGPGQWTRSPLGEAMAKIDQEGVDLLALDRALVELQRVDPDAAAVFQHRWFGGLSMEHIANILEIPADEAQRRWTRARKVMRGIMEGNRP